MALTQINPVPQYIPAVLKNNKDGWYIEYYALHPQKQELQRFRTRLNKIRKKYKKAMEFRNYAYNIVNQINAKLFGGWSPFFESEDVRLYTTLDEVIGVFLSEKERELRPDTVRTYRSWCALFQEWAGKNIPKVYVSLLNRVTMVKYMDYLYNVRKLSSRSWNNNLKQGRCFFNWCVEKCYMKENPLASLSKKKEADKIRVIIPPASRVKVTDYLQQHNPEFLTVCKLVYTSLIRPKEIRCIQLRDIHLKEHYIYIPPTKAKNHNGRCAAISEELETEISKLINEKIYPETYYLFGSSMKPAAKQIPEAKMRKTWEKMRAAVKLPVEMQLYSLRDTGINNMLKSGIDPLTVMQHADHHDLSMTTRYANHYDSTLIEKIREGAPSF